MTDGDAESASDWRSSRTDDAAPRPRVLRVTSKQSFRGMCPEGMHPEVDVDQMRKPHGALVAVSARADLAASMEWPLASTLRAFCIAQHRDASPGGVGPGRGRSSRSPVGRLLKPKLRAQKRTPQRTRNMS